MFESLNRAFAEMIQRAKSVGEELGSSSKRSQFLNSLLFVVLTTGMVSAIAGWFVELSLMLTPSWVNWLADEAFWIIFLSITVWVLGNSPKTIPVAHKAVWKLLGKRLHPDEHTWIYSGLKYLNEGTVFTIPKILEFESVFVGPRPIKVENLTAQACDGELMTGSLFMTARVGDLINYLNVISNGDEGHPLMMIGKQSEASFRTLIASFKGDKCRKMNGDFSRHIHCGATIAESETDDKDQTEDLQIPNLVEYAADLGVELMDTRVTDIEQSKEVIDEYNQQRAEMVEMATIDQILQAYKQHGVDGETASILHQIERGKRSADAKVFGIDPSTIKILQQVLNTISGRTITT